MIQRLLVYRAFCERTPAAPASTQIRSDMPEGPPWPKAPRPPIDQP
jgi:hypothetical protein